MKIVNLEEFRALPEYTLFAKYDPCVFGELETKYETWEHDFLCASIIDFQGNVSSEHWACILDEMEKNKSSVGLDFEHSGRDGLFEDNQMFAVFENKDIDDLIAHLRKCKH